MAYNDQKRMAEALSKLENSNTEYDGDIPDNARTFIRRVFGLFTAATNANGSNAIAANASPYQWRAPANGRVVQAHFIPSVASTANASDYANLSVIKTAANGIGAGSSAATQTTKPTANAGVGTLAPGAPVALTVDVANSTFTQGQVLAPKVAMTGNGVAMGAGSITLVVELEGPIDEAN